MQARVKVNKSTFLQPLKMGVLALVFSCIAVLLLALIAKLCNIGDKALPIINQVLKVIAVVVATILSVKEEKFLIKAIMGAVLFWLLSFAVFAIMGGQFHFGQIALDLGLALVAAIVVAIIKSRKAA